MKSLNLPQTLSKSSKYCPVTSPTISSTDLNFTPKTLSTFAEFEIPGLDFLTAPSTEILPALTASGNILAAIFGISPQTTSVVVTDRLVI